MSATKFAVCFVCTGNICRSPTAEGVFSSMAANAGLAIDVDSAGTHGYHVGDAPDPRSIKAAARRGYDLSALLARKFERPDFDNCNLILAMDRGHLVFLTGIAPRHHAHKLQMMMKYSSRFGEIDVPDPYYGGSAGFEQVLDLIEDAAAGLLKMLSAEAGHVKQV